MPRPGQRCRHNLNYWQFGDYLGIGAGAHGKLTFRASRRAPGRASASRRATWTRRSPARRVAQDVEVARDDLPFEFMLNALRLSEGFELARFAERTGLPLGAIEAPLAEAERRGLVERDLQRVRPTERGLRLPERPAGAVPACEVGPTSGRAVDRAPPARRSSAVECPAGVAKSRQRSRRWQRRC